MHTIGVGRVGRPYFLPTAAHLTPTYPTRPTAPAHSAGRASNRLSIPPLNSIPSGSRWAIRRSNRGNDSRVDVTIPVLSRSIGVAPVYTALALKRGPRVAPYVIVARAECSGRPSSGFPVPPSSVRSQPYPASSLNPPITPPTSASIPQVLPSATFP